MSSNILSLPQPTCPLCHAQGKVFIANSSDKFYSIPGTWDVMKCGNKSCELLWLNPMPRKDEIHKAYEEYYTHEAAPHGATLMRFLKPLENPYIEGKYGYPKTEKAYKYLLAKLLYLLPTERENVDASAAYLRYVKGGRLLDVGCGSGSFIAYLRGKGWSVEGTDFDPQAVEACKRQGLTAYAGDLRSLNLPAGNYDVVVFKHVVEHLYDVETYMEAAYRLLKPGGRVVILTPNAKDFAFTHYFKGSYFGLHTPCHLALYNTKNMAAILRRVGFKGINSRTSSGGAAMYYNSSRVIKKHGHLPPNSDKQSPLAKVTGRCRQMALHLLLFIRPTVGNQLWVTASR